MTWHVDMRSFWAGTRAMRWPHEHVNYQLEFTRGASRGWWLCLWTPVWHDGRGPYVSVGLWIMRFGRGY